MVFKLMNYKLCGEGESAGMLNFADAQFIDKKSRVLQLFSEQFTLCGARAFETLLSWKLSCTKPQSSE